MSDYPVILLKPERETHVLSKHHSIFRTAFGSIPSGVHDGDIVEVRSAQDIFLCYALLNRSAYIALRAFAFEKGDPLALLRRSIKRAIDMRSHFFAQESTTAYRYINAEGDGIPGLIVDRYGDVLVIQLTTLGMDRLREWILDLLMDLCHPVAIFEKSIGLARRKEGLSTIEGWVRGAHAGTFDIRERDLMYRITLSGSQKTGFFLDQRDMRSLVQSLASGRTVLDCCSYVGGFSLNALVGGALSADAVDYDAEAIGRAREHMSMNAIPSNSFMGYAENVFDFLRRRSLPRSYDFIILDPPAFAKRSSDLDKAKGAYVDLNRLAMQQLPPGGLLLTCSCSFQIDSSLFQTLLFHAARQAHRSVRILQRHRQAFDHPVNLFHPEVDYLKSLLLWIE